MISRHDSAEVSLWPSISLQENSDPLRLFLYLSLLSTHVCICMSAALVLFVNTECMHIRVAARVTLICIRHAQAKLATC